MAALFLLNGWSPHIPHQFEIAETMLLATLAWVIFYTQKAGKTGLAMS
jgi:hypothetical protein